MDNDRSFGFTESLFDFPRCNHSQGIGKENIGYTAGITNDGFPFEAELTRYGRDDGFYEELSVIMPDMGYWDEPDDEDIISGNESDEGADPEETDNADENIIGFANEIELQDFTALPTGMIDEGQEEDIEILK